MSLELIIGLVVLGALGVWLLWPDKKESEARIHAPWPFPVAERPPEAAAVEAPVAVTAEPEPAPKKAAAKKPRKTAAKRATKKAAK